MRLRLALALTAMTALPLAGAAIADRGAPLPEARSGGGLQLVAQLPGKGGTDLEFFSRKLPRYKNAAGKMVPAGRTPERHFAVVGNQTKNTEIVDITDPTKPFVAAQIPCTLSQGDIQVSAARSLVVIANGTSRAADACLYKDAATGEMKPTPPGSAIVDISDLYAPKVIGAAPTESGSHNNSLMPGGRFLYLNTSEIVEGQSYVPIYDLKDPSRPTLVGEYRGPGNSPHDIRFNAKGDRAYTAGISTFQILDTTDPIKPKRISAFFPPGASIGHDVLISPDGAFLFAGDEGGGGLPYPCPGGAVHVYDIRNEGAPVYLGQSYAGAGPVTNRTLESAEPGAVGACTSHVMEINPDGKSLTLGWYTAGSRVFDFSSLYGADGKPRSAPSLAYGKNGTGLVETGFIIPAGANTWSAKQYAKVPGFIFSDDLNLGFYVTKVPAKKG